jgi:phosphatidylglycerol:prolipoprotein diacylglycerol transferase
MLWILKQVQWQYLIFVFISGLIILFRERKTSESTVIRGFTDSRLDTRLGILLTVMLIFLLAHKWFTWPEIIAINMAILPAVILTTIEIKKSFYRINYKWIYLAGILLAPVMMSQTVLEEKPDTAGIKSFNSYRTIGGGPSFGHFTTLRDNFQGSGCDRVSNTEYFNHEYKGFGGGYSFTKVNTDRIEIITYGVNSFFGEYTQVRQSDLLKSKYYLAGINPYIRYDLNWLGVGAGLHLGNLFYSMGDAERETTGMPLKGFIHTPIFPQFYLRLGPKRIIWTDFHLADQFPLSAPGLNYQLGFGSDFGSRSGFNFRLGLSLTESDYYISSVIPVKNKIVIEPFFQWSDYQNDRQFSIGISNRFGQKKLENVP